MMKEQIIILNYQWKGTLEEKLRLTSEYRIIEEKIKDTINYLEELEHEETKIYNEIMENLEVKK